MRDSYDFSKGVRGKYAKCRDCYHGWDDHIGGGVCRACYDPVCTEFRREPNEDEIVERAFYDALQKGKNAAKEGSTTKDPIPSKLPPHRCQG